MAHVRIWLMDRRVETRPDRLLGPAASEMQRLLRGCCLCGLTFEECGRRFLESRKELNGGTI